MTESIYIEKLQTIYHLLESLKLHWSDEGKRDLLVAQVFNEISTLNTLNNTDEAKALAKLDRLNTGTFNIQQVDHLLVAFDRALTQDQVNEQFCVDTRDGNDKLEAFKIIVVLENIRSAHNVGSIIRSAECFNLQEVIFTGYTSTPESEKVLKVTMGTEKNIPWQHLANPLEAIDKLKSLGYSCVGVETSKQAKDLSEFEFAGPLAVFFGNERFGLSKEVIGQMDQLVKVPMYGLKNSLNVSVCAGIIFNQLVEKCQKL